MNLLNLARREEGLSKHISLTHLNSPSIFEGRNGEVGSVIKLRGMPFDTALNEDLNSAKRAWHHALCQVSEEYRLVVHITRHKVDIKLEGEFLDHFSKKMDERYQQQFLDHNLYQNDINLSLVHRGFSKQEASKNFFLGLSRKSLERAKLNFRERALNSLDKTTQQLMSSLSRFGPKLIGTQDEVLGYSELLETLSRPFNALKNFAYRYPKNNLPKGYLTRPEDYASWVKKYPEGDLSMYLPRMRIFFGQAIQFQKSSEEIYYGKCLSINWTLDKSPAQLNQNAV